MLSKVRTPSSMVRERERRREIEKRRERVRKREREIIPSTTYFV